MDLELGSLQRDVALGHRQFDGILVLEADVGKIVGTNLQKHDLAAVLEVVKQGFLRNFLVNVSHDNGQVGLELLRRIGRHHKQSLAAEVLLVPGQQQRHVVLAANPDERRNGPFRALLLLQEVNRQHRRRLVQVGLQLVLLGRRRNVFHVNKLLSVHRTAASAESSTHRKPKKSFFIQCKTVKRCKIDTFLQVIC